jgi:hypothetical protein
MTFKQVELSVCHNEMTKRYQNFALAIQKEIGFKVDYYTQSKYLTICQAKKRYWQAAVSGEWKN